MEKNFQKLNWQGYSINILAIICQIFFAKIKPDLIHTTDYEIYYKKKCPIVVTVHDLIHEIYYKDFGKDINYRPKKEILKISDHIICVSNNTKNDLMKYYDVSEKDISNISWKLIQNFEYMVIIISLILNFSYLLEAEKDIKIFSK